MSHQSINHQSAFKWLMDTLGEHTQFILSNEEVVRLWIDRYIYMGCDVAASCAVFETMVGHVDPPPKGMLCDLLCLFFDGTLKGTSTHLGPMFADHNDACAAGLQQLARMGVYTHGGQNTDTTIVGYEQRAYIEGSFVVMPDTDIHDIYGMFDQGCDMCFACVFDGAFAISTRGADTDFMLRFDDTIADTVEKVNNAIEHFVLTYDGGRPFTNPCVECDVYNLSRYSEKVVSFIVWDSHWDVPETRLEVRLADIVRKADFVMHV